MLALKTDKVRQINGLRVKEDEYAELKKRFDTQEKDFVAAKVQAAEAKGRFDQLHLKNRVLEQDYVNVKLKLAEACANLDDCRAIVANFAKPKSKGTETKRQTSIK